MKKTYFFRFIALIFIYLVANGILFSQPLSEIYCSAYSGCGFWIDGVTFAGITNTGTACSGSGYGSYVNINSDVVIGQTYLLTVTGTNTNSSSVCEAWIDWDQNDILTDPGETYTMNNSPGPGPYTASITIPDGANISSTRFRIRLGQGTVNPCGYAADGETEDYTITVLPAITVVDFGTNIFCPGQLLDVTYTTPLAFNPGNVFEAQLSDEYGGFSGYTVLGTFQGTVSGTIHAIIPPSTPPGGLYRVRVASTNPPHLSLDNGTDMLLFPAPDLVVTNPYMVCANNPVDITYTWYDQNYTDGDVSYWMNAACTVPVPQPEFVTIPGTYYIKKVTYDGCPDVKPVLVTNHPSPSMNAGPDDSVHMYTPYTLQASLVGGTPPFTVVWSPATGLDNPDILNPIATPLVNTTYTLTVHDGLYCTYTDDVNLTVLPPVLGTVSGVITYDNNNHTPMDSLQVFLKDSLGNIVSQTTTAGTGHYSFSDIYPGHYTLTAASTKLWGGCNAVDGLQILKCFAGLTTLTGIRLRAGDVNNTGNLNSIDALMVTKRFVGIQNSFITGDWVFENPVFLINFGNNLIMNFKALCFGDVNGSYVPPTK